MILNHSRLWLCKRILLLDKNGNLKISDFGLSIVYPGPDVDLPTPIGTAGYAAPDVLLGNARYKGDADIWSVGCVFVETFV